MERFFKRSFQEFPYWDWTKDWSTDPSVNSLFADPFMGPGGTAAGYWAVPSGPFTQAGGWILTNNDFILPGQSTPAQFLQRFLGQASSATISQNMVPPTLPTAAQLAVVLGLMPYDLTPWAMTELAFRSVLEGVADQRQSGLER